MAVILPNIPIEVETRKNVFVSQSSTGQRQTLIKSPAVRFYTLNFKNRDYDEYLDYLADWTTNYPATAVTWTNADIDASGFFYYDSDIRVIVDNPNNFEFSFNVRQRDGLSPTNPATTEITGRPNFTYEITNGKKVLINDSISFARKARSTSDAARQFLLSFKNRSLTETLQMENFWAYHYPQTQITFHDDVFDEDITFWLDSNFKWTVNGINLIDYSFVLTEVL